MCRSFRLTPVSPITSSNSDKYDKRMANRRLRRIVREHILDEKYQKYSLRDVSDIWMFSKDGKTRFNALEFPDYMRK
jgi:hypothetical protein